MAKKKKQKSEETEVMENIKSLAENAGADAALFTEEALANLEFLPSSEEANAELEASGELTESVSESETEELVECESLDATADESLTEGTELEGFASADVEDIEQLSPETVQSVVESLLFATDKPMSAASMKSAFQGTNIKVADIRKAIAQLELEYANANRGVSIIETNGGYQLRTKQENQKFLLGTVKSRPFKLSGPALEVLSIVAYKQPCTKSQVDEIRGVESGHLMRGLLDRGLIAFGEKSDLPGRPMQYETTRKFLEIFSLRNIHELPTLNEIEQLIPDGIGEAEEKKKTLSDITGELSTDVSGLTTYSEGEEELLDISKELTTIETTSAFFEEEKKRQREKRDAERAQDIRERLTIGEAVDEKDQKWLQKYENPAAP